jgi:hypothetical protein
VGGTAVAVATGVAVGGTADAGMGIKVAVGGTAVLVGTAKVTDGVLETVGVLHPANRINAENQQANTALFVDEFFMGI